MSTPTTTGNPAWWHTVLDRMSGLILHELRIEDFRDRIPAEAIEKDTLLSPGATAEGFDALETRLGRPYSASYRSLLQTSNGFAMFGKRVGRLLPAAEVDWFRKRNPEAAAKIADDLAQGKPKRPMGAHHPKWTADIPLYAIEITEAHQGQTMLLHPRRGRGGGEWDVWLYQPGAATQLASLADYLEKELRSLGKQA